MSWNYRIVKWDKDSDDAEFAEYAEPVYAIHEVYYNESGEPWGRTQHRDGPLAESPEELIRTLEMMLHDARKHPVMIEPVEWAKPDFDIDDLEGTPIEELFPELLEEPTQ